MVKKRPTLNQNAEGRPLVTRCNRFALWKVARGAGVSGEYLRPLGNRDRIASVLVDELWFVAPLGDEWVAAYRIVAQPEALAVGEVRVFPAEPNWREKQDPGGWSGSLLGARAIVPRGGLTRRLLDRVSLDQSLRCCRAKLIAMTGGQNQGARVVRGVLERSGITSAEQKKFPSPPERRARPGRKRLPERDYVRAAREYRRLYLQRPRPKGRLYEHLARRLGLSVGQAQNRIARAFEYGFLKDTPRLRRRRRTR